MGCNLNSVATTLTGDYGMRRDGLEAWAQRLFEAGISTEQEAEHYGLRLLSKERAKESIGYCLGDAAIEINYFNADGSKSKFSRYRFINWTKKGKYGQNQKGVKLYLSNNIDWMEVIRNPLRPIIITEGEFKALTCNIKTNHIAVGLGGVFNFTSLTDKFQGEVLSEDIRQFELRGRIVYICFDSDVESNEQVRRAELTLAALLRQRGADVLFVRLAPGSEAKIGLDDFINDGGDLSLKLRESTNDIDNDLLCEALSTWVDYRGDALNLKTGEVRVVSKLKNTWSNLFSGVNNVYKLWSTSAYRGAVTNIVFKPEDEFLLRNGEYNTWKGYKFYDVYPKTHEIQWWLDFKRDLFSEEPFLEREMDLFFAHLIQKPGVKQFRLPIIQHAKTGMGKSFLVESVAMAMNGGEQFNGCPAAVCGPTELDTDYVTIFEGKVFVIFNEPGEMGARRSNHIKDLVTGDWIDINQKFGLKYRIPNKCDMAFTTNMGYTHRFNVDSRRELVIHAADMMAEKPKEYWTELVASRKKNLYALAEYYLTYDLGDYNGRAPAPFSEAKQRMADRACTKFQEKLDDLPEMLIVSQIEIDMVSKKAISAELRDRDYVTGVRFGIGNKHGQISINGKLEIVMAKRHLWESGEVQRWLKQLKKGKGDAF